MNIYFYELSMTGVFHAEINSCFIKILSNVFPKTQNIFFIAEKNHVENCQLKLRNANINTIHFKKLPFFPKARLTTLISRDILGAFYCLHFFFKSKKDDVCFFAYILPLTHWVIFICNLYFKRKIFICLHGQMEAFLPDSPLQGTKKYFGLERYIFKKDLFNYYIILGESIYKEINFIFNVHSKVIVIDHPYDFSFQSKEIALFKFPIRFGHIGVGNVGKGSHLIFEIAEKLKKYIESGKIEFVIVGKLDSSIKNLDNGYVKWFNQSLDNFSFEREIKFLHYALLLRDFKTGRGVASGSFFDNVKYQLPYLSLNNAFVVEYARRFPSTGYIFNSIKELSDKIISILDNFEEAQIQYAIYKKNLDDMKNKLSLEEIAKFIQEKIS